MRRSQLSGALAAITIATAAAGCGHEGGRGSGGDPAEHKAVSNAGREKVPQWTLSPVPVTDIGGGEADALVMVTAGMVLDDRIVIADAGAAALRYYDRAGRLLRNAGRRGGGPGEFQHLTWVGLIPGDSVAVWDPVLRRVSVFDRAGRFGRMESLRFTQGPLPAVHGAFDDGSLLLSDALPVAQAPAAGTAWRDTLVYLRVGRGGEVMDTLGRFPGTERYVAASADGPGSRVHSLPFGRQAAAAARGNRFYVGTGDGYEVAAYGRDGTERLRIRKPHRPVALTSEDVKQFQATLIQVGGTENERRERARELERAPYPRTLPPYTSLTVDLRGALWVREPHRPGRLYESSLWSVFDEQGRWIATARGPGRFKVLQIGDDWVLGTETDRDDVDHVRLYALNRG